MPDDVTVPLPPSMQAADRVSRERWRVAAAATLWVTSSPDQRDAIARGGQALFVRRASDIYANQAFTRTDLEMIYDAFKSKWAEDTLKYTVIDAHGKVS